MLKELNEIKDKQLQSQTNTNREYQQRNINYLEKTDSEAASTMTEMKNSLKSFNSRLEQAEEKVNKFKDKSIEVIQLEES